MSLLHDSSLTFLVYCCFFWFSPLSFSSPIPTMPTKFHPHLQAWIHSTPVSPSSRPLSFSFGGAMHHGFHPKHPFKLLKSKLGRTDRQTFRPRFRWEMLIDIWISPRHWKDASGKKRSLESDTLYVFLCLETQVYKYLYVIVDHWFFWVTG